MPSRIRSASLTNYADVARSVGLDAFAMLDKVRLPRSCLDTPDMMISAGAVGRLLEISAAAAGIEDFGLRLAETRSLSNLGPVGLIVREQPTLRKAVEAMIRYQHLHNETLTLRMTDEEDVVVIRLGFRSRKPRAARQAVELSVATLYLILKTLIGPSSRAISASLTHGAPRARQSHTRIFGAQIRFGQEYNGVQCPRTVLDRPNGAADAVMARYVQIYLDSMCARPALDFRDIVDELIRVTLPAGNCSTEQIAGHLGIDRRTLHRRLARHGVSFVGLVDAVRIELVARYLEDAARPQVEIAELLGFSAASAFSRWFRETFGCTASQWRRNADGVSRSNPIRFD